MLLRVRPDAPKRRDFDHDVGCIGAVPISANHRRRVSIVRSTVRRWPAPARRRLARTAGGRTDNLPACDTLYVERSRPRRRGDVPASEARRRCAIRCSASWSCGGAGSSGATSAACADARATPPVSRPRRPAVRGDCRWPGAAWFRGRGETPIPAQCEPTHQGSATPTSGERQALRGRRVWVPALLV